jgi:hypothetical protein
MRQLSVRKLLGLFGDQNCPLSLTLLLATKYFPEDDQ